VERLLSLCVSVPAAALASESGYWVIYDGGSIGGILAGSAIVLALDSDQIRFVKKHDTGYTIEFNLDA